MPYDTKFALIDLTKFTEQSAVVENIFQYIIQGTWSVTSFSSSKFLGVGLPGTPPVTEDELFPYTMWINGSAYINDYCKFNENVQINGSLEVKTDLTVRGITNCNFLTIENASINNASLGKTNMLGQTNLLGSTSIKGKTTIYASHELSNQLNIYNDTTRNASNTIIHERVPDNASRCDIFMHANTYIDVLYANSIHCGSVTDLADNMSSMTNVVRLFVNNQPNAVDFVEQGKVMFGDEAPIEIISYTYGDIEHGTNGGRYNEKSSFNLFATNINKTSSDIGVGIHYDGPVNIGCDKRDVLNIYGTGLIDVSGNLNIHTEINSNALTIHGNSILTGSLEVTKEVVVGGNITVDGNITSYSDIKLKNNIVKLSNCLNNIDTINGYSYTRNDLGNTKKQHIGLIAQEVEKMYPQLVEDKDNIKSVNYQAIIAILVECIKELKSEINKLKY
jgi:cytoskeletal protein CcmA (bactofilin family)